MALQKLMFMDNNCADISIKEGDVLIRGDVEGRDIFVFAESKCWL